jgi:hypothetical protein
MEGNFLSRYKNKIENWTNLIDTDPSNKKRYEAEMSDYMIRCMPYMNQYAEEGEEVTNTDNIFNVKETVGLQRKDIFRDYLIDVENQNIARPRERRVEQCETCSTSNVIHIPDTSELVCDSCGLVLACLISEELTYREEQETGEDEYLQYFPLLKSKSKLYAQDQIWKKICRDLQWEFIPTI